MQLPSGRPAEPGSLAQLASRESLADEFCQAAQNYLELARQAGYTRAELLESASDCFGLALELRPDCVPALLGLAFLAALADLYTLALDLLSQAEALDPQSIRLIHLRQEVQHLAQSQVDPHCLEAVLPPTMLETPDFAACAPARLLAQSLLVPGLTRFLQGV